MEELESLKAWAGENPEYVRPSGTLLRHLSTYRTHHLSGHILTLLHPAYTIMGATLCRSAEKHPAKGIFAPAEGKRRRRPTWRRQEGDTATGAVQVNEASSDGSPARLEGLLEASASPCGAVSRRLQLSRDSGSAAADAQQSPVMLRDLEEQGEGRQAAGSWGALQQPILLQDSEEQDAAVQPSRYSSGIQTVPFLLDSEDQVDTVQPDVARESTQHDSFGPTSEEQVHTRVHHSGPSQGVQPATAPTSCAEEAPTGSRCGTCSAEKTAAVASERCVEEGGQLQKALAEHGQEGHASQDRSRAAREVRALRLFSFDK